MALLSLFLPAVVVVGAARRPAPTLVVISIDGLRPADVLESEARGIRVPNLRRLVAEGAHATAVRGVLPTVTYPSHATLVTGVSPARHWILANRPFDPSGRDGDRWYWYAEDIRVPTLWDVATDAALVTSSVDWPVTVGARIRYNIAQYWRAPGADGPEDAKLDRALSTPPGLLAEAERVLGPYPSGRAYTVEDDRRRAEFNAYLIETHRPRLHLCYFSGLDEAQHSAGPGSDAARDALEKIDALVGRLRVTAAKVGGGRATVAVVSDHGFVRTTRELELGRALRAAGLHERTSVWDNGGSAAIVLRDAHDDDARRGVARVLHELAALPESPVERVLVGEDARAAGGFPNAAFVVGLKPDTRIGDGGGWRVVHDAPAQGTHGQLPTREEMSASFIVAGPGVPSGRDLGRIDMRDVAPTLARLIGVTLPGAEGKDALAPIQ